MNELIVSTDDEGLRIGILEKKRIVELHHEKTNTQFTVGDIFLGRVKKLVPGLNAAFVEIGHPRDAFLHYLDLGPQVRSLQRFVKSVHSSAQNIKPLETFQRFPDIDKHGKIGLVLKNNQKILVQVVKEAISTKGPRLNCEISLPGQYLILVPFGTEISVSRKVASLPEKKRLKKLVEGIAPGNFGIIIRTAAEGKDLKALQSDLEDLLEKWNGMAQALVQSKVSQKVLQEQTRTTSILRDMLSIGFDSIVTDDKPTFDEIHAYLKKKLPEEVKNLKMYKGRLKLFEAYGIEKQIKATFGKTVTMANGSYLVIEHTEALHVIDVNSGSKNLTKATLEENALKTNLDAATEIARQLRLRDMGGIVIVDFIDLKKSENKKELYLHLKAAMKNDRAKHSILQMSRFGLVQITRQRVRPEIHITTQEVCPSCSGTGKIQPSILIADKISSNIEFLMKQNQESKVTLEVNPFVGAFLTKGFKNYPVRWFLKYRKWIKVKTDNSLPFTEVKYFNSRGEEIKF